MTITETDGHFKIEFPYKQWLVDKVKELPGRYFNPTIKAWLVPKSAYNEVADFARANGFTFAGNGGAAYVEQTFEIPALPELAVDIPLKREPFPFQKTGIAYALQKKRLIIGDEPGLGKTGQAIATLVGADAFPALIICPSSLKINWKKEVEIWSNKKAMILEDRVKNSFTQYYKAGLAQIFIVNYESLKKFFVQSLDVPEGAKLRLNHIKFKENINFFKSVVIDESHRVKSLATKQTKFTKGICKGKEYILALTGTPVVNKPKDLISQLGIIDRMDEFGGYNRFVNTYCSGPKEASNLKELNYKLNTICFYRRDKKTVLKDLPSKMRQVVSCEITNRKEYEDAERDLEKYLQQYKNATDEQVQKSMKGEIMVRIGILKNISARGKMNDVLDFISDTLDSGEKLGIFAHQHQIIDMIKERYPGVPCITGREDIHQRQAAVEAFQNNPNVKLILLGIQAAGVGLTLTAGSRCGFIELGWHPAIHDQCEDRFHRIGQSDSVQCTYFLGKDTIDEWVYQLIEEKRGMANAITGATDDVETNTIDNIINLFNQKKVA